MLFVFLCRLIAAGIFICDKQRRDLLYGDMKNEAFICIIRLTEVSDEVFYDAGEEGKFLSFCPCSSFSFNRKFSSSFCNFSASIFRSRCSFRNTQAHNAKEHKRIIAHTPARSISDNPQLKRSTCGLL
jgi:hypothetical protein